MELTAVRAVRILISRLLSCHGHAGLAACGAQNSSGAGFAFGAHRGAYQGMCWAWECSDNSNDDMPGLAGGQHRATALLSWEGCKSSGSLSPWAVTWG